MPPDAREYVPADEKDGLPESSPGKMPPQVGSHRCNPATERGALEGEATDKLAPGRELTQALLSRVGGSESMGASMIRRVSKFISIGRAISSSELSMEPPRGEGLGVVSCSFPFRHFLTQRPSFCCTAAQGVGMLFSLWTISMNRCADDRHER